MDLLKPLKLFIHILKFKDVIIHQISNSSKYVSYKDLKEFNADLKLVYKSATEEATLAELERFEQKWGDKYLIAIRSWKNNWDELATFFKYSQEIRKIIYTTNAMESYNRQLRKVTKAKSIFPYDNALLSE
nr:transposase [Clostridium botulinum]